MKQQQKTESKYSPLNLHTISLQFLSIYRAFSNEVTAAILVFQNNKTVAMLVFQTSPVGVDLFSYVNTFFCSHKFA